MTLIYLQYGEKLSLIAQASGPVLELLPSVPSNTYDGHQKSGEVRAALQASLDNWKPGQVTLMAGAGALLDRSHTRAFGETHAAEISPTGSPEEKISSLSRSKRRNMSWGLEIEATAQSGGTTVDGEREAGMPG